MRRVFNANAILGGLGLIWFVPIPIESLKAFQVDALRPKVGIRGHKKFKRYFSSKGTVSLRQGVVTRVSSR